MIEEHGTASSVTVERPIRRRRDGKWFDTATSTKIAFRHQDLRRRPPVWFRDHTLYRNRRGDFFRVDVEVYRVTKALMKASMIARVRPETKHVYLIPMTKEEAMKWLKGPDVEVFDRNILSDVDAYFRTAKAVKQIINGAVSVAGTNSSRSHH
jgi:hypothetical protein